MSDDKNIGYILIDPPVTPFSPEEDILAWINQLEAHPDHERPEVQEAVAMAKEYLKWKEESQY